MVVVSALTSYLEEFVFHVNGNGAVTLGVGHAGEDESIANLVVIQKCLFGLVDFSAQHFSRARRASPGTATVGEFHARFFGGIDNEHVVGTFNGGINVVFLRNQLDRVTEGRGSRRGGTGRHHGGESFHNGGGGKENKQGLGEHGWYVVVVVVVEVYGIRGW